MKAIKPVSAVGSRIRETGDRIPSVRYEAGYDVLRISSRRRPPTVVVALGAVLLALLGGESRPVSAAAGAGQTIATVGGTLGPVDRPLKLPRSVVAMQVVPAAIEIPEGGFRLCAAYDQPAGSNPDKGNLSARVEVVRSQGGRVVHSIPQVGVRGGRARTCTETAVDLLPGDVLTWTFQLKSMPKLAQGDAAHFSGEVLAAGENFGAFRVSASDFDETPLWIDGANRVFCTTDAGFADLWIRLAAEKTADGENGPHLDLDLCNYQGGGSFRPHDAANPSCGTTRTFDVFWHDPSGEVFVNAPSAPACELILNDDGDTLEGTFTCARLTSSGGATVDVLGGAFHCKVD